MSLVDHQAGAYLWLLEHEVTRSNFYSPLGGMPVHPRVTPSTKFAGTHLYTWVKRHYESKVTGPRTQHNDPARARTQTA